MLQQSVSSSLFRVGQVIIGFDYCYTLREEIRLDPMLRSCFCLGVLMCGPLQDMQDPSY